MHALVKSATAPAAGGMPSMGPYIKTRPESQDPTRKQPARVEVDVQNDARRRRLRRV